MSRVRLVEHKTSSESIEIGSTFWRRLSLAPQWSVYLEAAMALGFDCCEVEYDVIRKLDLRPSQIPLTDAEGVKIVLDASGVRVKTKDGKKWRQTGEAAEGFILQSRPETPEEFYARCIATIAEDPEKFYQRGVVVRLEDERREASLDTWQTASAIRDARRLNLWPKNGDSCVQYSRACSYFDVCCKIASIDDPVLFSTSPTAHAELSIVGDDLLTQSSMRAYRACPRKFFYRYEQRKRSVRDTAEPLRMGTSIHRALETWWSTDGDLSAALAKLDSGDPFLNAKERAMMTGYHARWVKPEGVVSVEREWVIGLVNPETGAASRTWRVAGKFDVMVRADSGEN